MSHVKEERVHIRFHHADGDYVFLGFNPHHEDRVIIATTDESVVGTVKINCCRPLKTTWDELRRQHGSAAPSSSQTRAA